MVLDYVDNLELPDALVPEHHDAVQTLARLSEGLDWLYRTVWQLEQKAAALARRDNVVECYAGGLLDHLPLGLLSCLFQWYAVSACNVADLIARLARLDSEEPKDYRKRVMPRVSNYRDKVAAHFAFVSPRREDNDADLAASVMTQIVFLRGRLCAAALSRVLHDGAQEITVSRDLSWSLTLAHERLKPRYWPHGVPKAHQSMYIPAKSTVTIEASWSDLVGDGT